MQKNEWSHGMRHFLCTDRHLKTRTIYTFRSIFIKHFAADIVFVAEREALKFSEPLIVPCYALPLASLDYITIWNTSTINGIVTIANIVVITLIALAYCESFPYT